MTQLSKQLGYFIAYRNCEFFLPFVCQKCGKCCEAPIPSCVASGMWSIAKHLGISVEDLVTKRFKGMAVVVREKGREYIKRLTDWELSSCPFLTEDHQCEVYPVRPEGCRLFPIETDFGACEIDCPGYKEFHRIRKELFRQRIYCEASSFSLGKREPHYSEWPIILRKVRRANPSTIMMKRFISANNIPEDFNCI